MVIGRVFRGIGRAVGAIHGGVFRVLGRIPIVGGAFKALGAFSAKGIGMMGALSPMAMLGLGEYSPFSSFTSGFAQGSMGQQTGTQGMGNQFNNVFGMPMDMSGQNLGVFGNQQGYNPAYGQTPYGQNYGNHFPGVYGNQGPYGMPPFGRRPCCCCCGHRPF